MNFLLVSTTSKQPVDSLSHTIERIIDMRFFSEHIKKNPSYDHSYRMRPALVSGRHDALQRRDARVSYDGSSTTDLREFMRSCGSVASHELGHHRGTG